MPPPPVQPQPVAARPNFLPYQWDGALWLAEPKHARAGLFDDPGLGKTATTLLAAQLVGASRVLVLAPSIVASNWCDEVRRFWPHAVPELADFGAYQLSRHTTGPVDPTARPRVVVTTHGLLLRKLREQLFAQTWDAVILDESHFFRGPDAARSIAFYGARGSDGVVSGGLVERARRVWCLSGTPMPNHAAELWTFLTLFPDRIRSQRGGVLSWDSFARKMCRTRQTVYGLEIVGNRDAAAIRAAMAGTYLRRLKKDVLASLPPVRFQTVRLIGDASGELRQVAEATTRALAAWDTREEQIADDREAKGLPPIPALPAKQASDAALWSALESNTAASTFFRLCGLAKVRAASELLADELETGAIKKVVVFARHSEVIAQLSDNLRRFGVVTVTGTTTSADRAQNVRQFQTDPAVRVFVGNIIAAGTGATLTAASELVFVEMSGVPGENRQAADRIHRLGQTEPVRVRFLALAGTADEKVTRRLRRKLQAIVEVLGAA